MKLELCEPQLSVHELGHHLATKYPLYLQLLGPYLNSMFDVHSKVLYQLELSVCKKGELTIVKFLNMYSTIKISGLYDDMIYGCVRKWDILGCIELVLN